MNKVPVSAAVIDDGWYREIVESAPNATIGLDEHDNIILVNQQTEAIFGYERAELLGRNIEDLVPMRHRYSQDKHRANLFPNARLNKTNPGLYLSGKHKNGNRFPVEINLRSIPTPHGQFAIATVRDTASRIAIEEQFRNLLETAPDAMLILNQEGTITLANAQVEKMFGYSRDQIIDAPVEMLMPAHYGKRNFARRASTFFHFNRRKNDPRIELRGKNANGTEFPVEVTLSPLDISHGKFLTVAVRDITNRKNSEKKLKDYARALEASNKELEDFAYVASHDLQAPLRNIISFSELLHDECFGKVNDDADMYFGYIEESAQRLQELIRDILEVSRVNRMQRGFDIVDLNDCVADCREQLRAPLRESGGLIISGPLPKVLGNSTRLTQLFRNLLSNALKFRRSDVAPRITIEAQPQGKLWQVSVTDNGIGMDPDECSQVFEIFRRLHTVDEYPGTGIGLSICKKIVEIHGGEITVESPGETGTTFKFTLPDADNNKLGIDAGKA